MAPGRYGRGVLLRSGTALRPSSRLVTQKMGLRRYTAWLRRRRRQPYRGVGGTTRPLSRRRVGRLELGLNSEQLYRARGTLPRQRRHRLLNAGRGLRRDRLPAGQRISGDYSALGSEQLLENLRRHRHYYQRPRSRRLWFARRYGRLVLRKRHHRRSKRLPRLLAQRLVLLANFHPLVTLQRRWLAQRLGHSAGLGLAQPAPLGRSFALLLGLLRLRPRRRSRLWSALPRRMPRNRRLEQRWLQHRSRRREKARKEEKRLRGRRSPAQSRRSALRRRGGLKSHRRRANRLPQRPRGLL